MRISNLIRGRQLIAVLIWVITSACTEQAINPTAKPATEVPVVQASVETTEKPVATATAPMPSATAVSFTAEPSPTVITETPTPTTIEVETLAPTEPPVVETSATPGFSSKGIWISDHDKRGARTWVEFEIYTKDGEQKIDVLEACVNYSCEYLGEIIVMEGCSKDKSPKGIQIRNGKFIIDFHGIMPEKFTHHSRLGMIYGQLLDTDVITGSWIIPACDYWMPFDVRYTVETATP